MISKTAFKLKKDGTTDSHCICRTPELIENYDKAVADTTQTWFCHHRLETHNPNGKRRSVDISEEELIALGMYFDRPPEELIFLTQAEHKVLHQKGKKRSEETKQKIAENKKGKPSGHGGKHHSEETKKRLAEANKGKHWKLSEETKKRMSAAKKDRHWKLVDGKRVWY